MVGYGPEDNHFVMELTYNYTVKSYEKGNEFIGITIKSKEALDRAKEQNWPILPGNVLEAPGGYRFFIKDEPQPTDRGVKCKIKCYVFCVNYDYSDPVEKVTLACSDLKKSIHYWNEIVGLKIFEETDKSVVVGFQENEAKLELQQISILSFL